MSARLAIQGGKKAVTLDQSQVSQWPIIDDEVIAAVTGQLKPGELAALRRSGAAWFIVSGSEDSVADFLAELNGSIVRGGLAAAAQQTNFGDLSVIRVTGIR